MLRIQLSTKSVTNLVPGGTAAGSTLGYRLLVAAGVAGPDAAFTLATVGLASAVVLNVLLWLALLVSIPRGGFHPLYVTAAIVGVVVLALFAALVVLLMKGREPAERITRDIARHIPKVEPDQAVALLHRIADQMQALADRPDLVRGGIGWATLNWLLDAGSLWVFLAAFGARVAPRQPARVLRAGERAGRHPAHPGRSRRGRGGAHVDARGLRRRRGGRRGGGGHLPPRRFWLPIPLGAFSYATLRYGPVPLAQTVQLKPLALEAFSDGGAPDGRLTRSPAPGIRWRARATGSGRSRGPGQRVAGGVPGLVDEVLGEHRVGRLRMPSGLPGDESISTAMKRSPSSSRRRSKRSAGTSGSPVKRRPSTQTPSRGPRLDARRGRRREMPRSRLPLAADRERAATAG